MASSPSWSSSVAPEDHFSSSQLRPSSSPEWSSCSPASSQDGVPLAQRRAGARAPLRDRPRPVSAPLRMGRESPEGTASTITGKEILNLSVKFRIPVDIKLYVPTPDDRVISSRPKRVALYPAYFRAGLRLPLHPFIVSLLDRYSLTLSQLVPNSVRTVCGFLVMCHLIGVEARVSLFRSFYILRQQRGWWMFQPRPSRVLKLGLPTSVKGWKTRFFFADIPGVKAGWGDPDVSPNKNSLVIPNDKMAFGKLLTAEVPTCNQLLSEANLRFAGILPNSGESPYPSSFLFFSSPLCLHPRFFLSPFLFFTLMPAPSLLSLSFSSSF